MDASRTSRAVAAGCLVLVALLATGCDVVIGPPPQDVGEQSNAAVLPH